MVTVVWEDSILFWNKLMSIIIFIEISFWYCKNDSGKGGKKKEAFEPENIFLACLSAFSWARLGYIFDL